MYNDNERITIYQERINFKKLQLQRKQDKLQSFELTYSEKQEIELETAILKSDIAVLENKLIDLGVIL